MTEEHRWDAHTTLSLEESSPASVVRTGDIDDRTRWKRRAEAAFGQHPVLPGVVAAVLGAVLAALLVGVHALLPAEALPEFLQIPLTTARILLAGLAGTIVTVIAVLFWIRSAAVQLAAFQFPAHLMQRYLADKWQQRRMALVVGTFSYLVVATWFMPEDETETVPHLAVLVGLGLVLVSIFAVISSVAASARFMFVSEIAGRLSENLVDQIRAWDRPDRDTFGESFGPTPALEDSRPVMSNVSGWLKDIDEGAVLRSLPEGSAVWMETRIGSFVMQDEALATIWTPEETDGGVDDAIRNAIEIGSSRKLETDLDYGIQLLADAAFRSLSPGNDDITGAAEGIYQLGVVMRELIASEAPAKVRVDQQGRRLVRAKDFDSSDYIRRVLEHLDSDVIVHSRSAFETTIDALGRLAELARRLDDHQTVKMIETHVANLLARYRKSEPDDGELQDLIEHAQTRGFGQVD